MSQRSPSKESQFQGYNQFETDDQYLQDLAYKAKFAEEISNNMRVPKTITMAEDEDAANSTLPGSYNGNVDTSMSVPSRIVLNRMESEALEMNGSNESLNTSSEMTPKKRALTLDNNDDNSYNRQIELKTPPRVLGVLDRLETGDTPQLTAEQLNKFSKQISVGQAADEALKNEHIQNLDLEAALKQFDLLAEDPTSAIIRQQLQKLNRRVITLEKERADRLKTEKFNQTLLYATCGLAGLALVVAFSSHRSSTSLISYY